MEKAALSSEYQYTTSDATDINIVLHDYHQGDVFGCGSSNVSRRNRSKRLMVCKGLIHGSDTMYGNRHKCSDVKRGGIWQIYYKQLPE
jgi:hypothetical protein